MDTVELAEKLISYNTVSPVKKPEIFKFIAEYLESEGVDVEIYDVNGVKNLTAETGHGDTSICFNGHVDVVPPESDWDVTEPFNPLLKEGKLYGRGATDMKGGVAAMINAFLDLHREPEFDNSITLMITGDEEIGGENGTKHLLDAYNSNGHQFDYALVGEPTDLNIQTGTRGVLWLNIEINGDTTHTTRSGKAEANVVEDLPKMIDKIRSIEFDYSERTSLPSPTIEIGSVNTDRTYNSLPGHAELGVDVRYLPDQNPEQIRKRIEEELSSFRCEAQVEVEKDHGGAFELKDNFFLESVTEAVQKSAKKQPEYITEGGASDGRFFAEKGTPFVELGTNQEMTHRDDEYIHVENLEKLRSVYYRVGKKIAEGRQEPEIPGEKPRASKL